MISTVAGIAVDRGIIPNLDEPVGNTIKDGGYDSPHNSTITWRHHLQNESEWEGEMWGKNANFIGAEAFGRGEMKPHELGAPGSRYEYNDVRINRFALSLLERFKKPLPDVFRDEIMNPIGASNTWKWVPYANSYAMIDGKRMPSIAGGTRWGGGMWISSLDQARFGLLWLRRGKWGDKQLVSESYVKQALTPSPHGRDYGFLWYLNTEGREWQGSPTNMFKASGNGGNVIYMDPAHDLVMVWRWSGMTAQGIKRIVDSVIE
jgi:CubicO group peptidase (beta-lactamase class C family)